MNADVRGVFRDFHEFDVPLSQTLDDKDYCLACADKRSDVWVPFLSFPITKRCNFRCAYCGVGGEATASDNAQIEPQQIRTIVSLAAQKGIRKFRLTGGEPFTHREVGRILEIFNEFGYFTLINTNGSLLTEHEGLLRTLRSNFRFAVSLDTLVPERLKEISCVDMHKQIIDGIMLLRELGLLMRINTVVTQMNFHEIPDILSFCQKLGCDLKLLDVVSVPVPFGDRQSIYQEISTLERKMSEGCDEILSHEYTRGFGTPCKRYRFGKTCVTVKNSVKGSHYDIGDGGLCCKCQYYPCHEGLYDIFALSDGRLCSCRWTEVQKCEKMDSQLDFLINAFRRSVFVSRSSNADMCARTELLVE